MKKYLTLVTAFLLFSKLPTVNAQNDEILWDTWGVPHIYASSEDNLYKMMGWSQMKNHGDLILKLYGEARGKSSEYWGRDFQRDMLLKKLGIEKAAKSGLNKLPDEDKAMIKAFVEGINAYANKHPDLINDDLEKVLPVTAQDVLLHTYRVFYMEFLINFKLYGVSDWNPGSNAWAIRGAKTESGNSMLMANPHLLWRDFWLFYEAQLITENNNLYGATLVGLPTIGIGFNENLGWTHTVNTLDNVDFYEVNTQGDKYLIDGQWKAFEVDTSFVVQQTDSSEKKTPVLIKYSDYGAVLRESDEKALIVKWPNMNGNLNILGQWRKMGNARSHADFSSALELNGLPLFNTIYSDKENNISFHFGGNVPIKSGSWDKWEGIVKTSSSEDLWKGIYSLEELPHYTNPESGWIQNANDPPYTSTVPTVLDPAKYSNNISPNFMSFRAQRSASLINNKTGLTLDEVANLKQDTRSEIALRLKDDLHNLKNQTRDSLTLEALSTLTFWDGSFDADSEGALLFMDFMTRLNANTLFEKRWSFETPLSTPDGFNNKEQVLEALKAAALNQQENFGSLSTPYGEVFRLRVGEHEYAASGGSEDYGIFRTIHSAQWGNGKYYQYYGDTFVLVVEFGETPRAKGLLSYGNATQTGSRHIGDQLKLFSEKKLRDIWLTRQDQEANLELLERLSSMDNF